MPQKTDEEIAAQIQRGDSELFGVLVERYERKISNYARKFIADSEDIKDLVQEVFIKAYVNLKSFDSNRKFSSWLYRIAHNEFINALKKKGREKITFFDLNFDILFPHLILSKAPDNNLANGELRLMLDRSLSKLSPKYREVLALYYYEELNYYEIADILRIPVSTVGVRLKRGKVMLKKIINQTEKI